MIDEPMCSWIPANDLQFFGCLMIRAADGRDVFSHTPSLVQSPTAAGSRIRSYNSATGKSAAS